MPRRVAPKTTIAQPRTLAMLTVFCVGLVFSSISHAENDERLRTKLEKLGYTQGESVERVEHYRVDGWNYIDDEHIVIYAGPSKRFLITTMNHCPDLSSAEHIGFTTTTSFLTKFDKLIVRGAGGIVQHCPISGINALQKDSSND